MKKRQRISPGKDFLMKITAAGFDAIGALASITAIGGTIVGIFGDLTFMFWYLIIGAGLINRKTLGRAGISFIIELIPFVNILPGFSLFVWRQNRAIMKEDAEYNKKHEKQIKEKREKEVTRAKEEEEVRQIRSSQEILEQEETEGALLENQSLEMQKIRSEDVLKKEEELFLERMTKDQELVEEERKKKELLMKLGEDLKNFDGNTLGAARISKSDASVEYDKDKIGLKSPINRRDAGYQPLRKRSQGQGQSTNPIEKKTLGSAKAFGSDAQLSYEEGENKTNSLKMAMANSTKESSSSTQKSGLSHTVAGPIPGYKVKVDSGPAMKKIKDYYGGRNVVSSKTISDARQKFANDPEVKAFLDQNMDNQAVADHINML